MYTQPSKDFPITGTEDIRVDDEIRFVEPSKSGKSLVCIDARVKSTLSGQDVVKLLVMRAKGPSAPKVGKTTLRSKSRLIECGFTRKQRRYELGAPTVLSSLHPFNRSPHFIMDAFFRDTTKIQ